MTAERATDILIVGGGTGGVAAALAALRLGRRVILSEETDWIGGQLSAQAVPPDEHPWIEQTGATHSYMQFAEGVRDYYRRHYPLTEAARSIVNLNPGNGNVSRLCHEPRAALAVMEAMLAPWCSSGQLEILAPVRPGQRRNRWRPRARGDPAQPGERRRDRHQRALDPRRHRAG